MNRRTIMKSAAGAGAGAVVAAAASKIIGASAGSAATQPARRQGDSLLVTRDGARLFYNDWGAGNPVVFNHAWGLNADIWEYQLTELNDQGLRCVAYDKRGHGRSSDPGRGYDYDTLSDDLAAIIEELDLHDVTLVGFSMGSGEVARYLSRHGTERVKRAVLVSVVGPMSAGGGILDSFVAGLKTDRPAFLAGGLPLFIGDETAVSPAMAQWIIAQFLRASPKAIIECMRVKSDFRADFPAFAVPTMIIHGAKDQISPIDKTAKLTAPLIRGCELKIYEDAPHGLVITHRDRLTNDLLKFIKA
jgi:non-heme chloroperoxidase